MFDFSTPVRGEPVDVTLPPGFSDRTDAGTILRVRLDTPPDIR